MVERVTIDKLRALTALFAGDLDAAPRAEIKALRKLPGIGTKTAEAIRAVDVEAVTNAVAGWQAAGVRIVHFDDDAYPAALRAFPDAPGVLFMRGDASPDILARPCAAVVGTRTPSACAREQAENLAFQLVEQGYTIVSGLALGVDALAHRGALAHPDGRLAAVLGGGVIEPYPPENRELAAAIMRRGVLLCETPPDAPVSRTRLVMRNRLISGLCEQVIVVETPTDGGAMHAARFALAQGKRLRVVGLSASGNQALIDAGAEVIPIDTEN